MYSGNVPRSILTDDGVCTTGESWIRKNILSSSDSKEEDSLSNPDLDLKNMTSTKTRKRSSKGQ